MPGFHLGERARHSLPLLAHGACLAENQCPAVGVGKGGYDLGDEVAYLTSVAGGLVDPAIAGPGGCALRSSISIRDFLTTCFLTTI
jgi:hypothetical protein